VNIRRFTPPEPINCAGGVKLSSNERPPYRLRTMRDVTTWFCDAYASWQKGGIENANGRLRRWLPRHLDIDRTSDQDIQGDRPHNEPHAPYGRAHDVVRSAINLKHAGSNREDGLARGTAGVDTLRTQQTV
jgi:hypothetical protein